MSQRQFSAQNSSAPNKKTDDELIDIPLRPRAERRAHNIAGPPWDTETGFVIFDRRSHRERRKNWN